MRSARSRRTIRLLKQPPEINRGEPARPSLLYGLSCIVLDFAAGVVIGCSCVPGPQEGMPSSIAVPSSWSFHVSIITNGNGSSAGKYLCHKLEVSAKVWPHRADICLLSPQDALLSSKLDHAAPTIILSEYFDCIV